METNEYETLWTAKDLMSYLHCGKTTFFKAKRRGDLPPAIIIGQGIHRWNPSTVYEWVKTQESIAEIDPVRSNKNLKTSKKRRGRPTKVDQIEGLK